MCGSPELEIVFSVFTGTFFLRGRHGLGCTGWPLYIPNCTGVGSNPDAHVWLSLGTWGKDWKMEKFITIRPSWKHPIKQTSTETGKPECPEAQGMPVIRHEEPPGPAKPSQSWTPAQCVWSRKRSRPQPTTLACSHPAAGSGAMTQHHWFFWFRKLMSNQEICSLLGALLILEPSSSYKVYVFCWLPLVKLVLQKGDQPRNHLPVSDATKVGQLQALLPCQLYRAVPSCATRPPGVSHVSCLCNLSKVMEFFFWHPNSEAMAKHPLPCLHCFPGAWGEDGWELQSQCAEVVPWGPD